MFVHEIEFYGDRSLELLSNVGKEFVIAASGKLGPVLVELEKYVTGCVLKNAILLPSANLQETVSM